jgi:hypothetical protein
MADTAPLAERRNEAQAAMEDEQRRQAKIAKETEFCSQHMNKYPVISISFKEAAGQEDWSECYEELCTCIQTVFETHDYLLDWEKLSATKKTHFEAILNGTASSVKMKNSLLFLSRLLKDYHQKSVYVFIDEYDAPIHTAYVSTQIMHL